MVNIGFSFGGRPFAEGNGRRLLREFRRLKASVGEDGERLAGGRDEVVINFRHEKFVRDARLCGDDPEGIHDFG